MRSQPWDDINWEALTHWNESAPDQIRAALHTLYAPAASIDAIGDAIQRLYAYDVPMTSVLPTTLPHILDFTLPLMRIQQFSGMASLHAFIRDSILGLRKIRDKAAGALHAMQFVVHCTVILNKHMDTVLTVYEQSTNTDARSIAREVIVQLYDNLPEVVPALIDIYHRTARVIIKHQVVSDLLKLCNMYATRTQHSPELEPPAPVRPAFEQIRWLVSSMLQRETDEFLRYEAAILAVNAPTGQPSRDEVLQTLRAFVATPRYWIMNHYLLAYPHIYTVPHLLRLLSHPHTPPEHVHDFLMRYALATNRIILETVPRTGERRHQPGYENLSPRLQYSVTPILLFNVIVNCDRYWEIPSTFLSSYFDLPDNRDALRQYLNEHDTEHR